jgi:hypothetical protein
LLSFRVLNESRQRMNRTLASARFSLTPNFSWVLGRDDVDLGSN